MPACTAVFDTFQPLSCDIRQVFFNKLNRTTCGLDPFPTKLLMSHLSSIINIILHIVNLCFSLGDFPASCKSAIISPLIKKQDLDSEILKNYRPVANLSFISKIIEKAIATQIHSHLINDDIVDNFQSAYKTGHSCETPLLRVYNDIVTTIGRGNGAMIVYLIYLRDLGVIFDQILNVDDHITAICRSTHFHIRNIGKIRNLLSYDACSTIIHALISCRLDYCNSILYNVQKVKLTDYKDFRINVHVS